MAQNRLLPDQYRDLSGTELLDALRADGRLDVLQALFQFGNPEVCAAAAAPILASRDARLVDRLAREVLKPTVGDPFPEALIAALQREKPKLSPALAEELISRLLDETPLDNAQYEAGRWRLECWATRQGTKSSDEFALNVIEGETPCAENPTVRRFAFARCAAEQRLRKKVVELILARPEPDSRDWEDGSALMEAAPMPDGLPQELRPLAAWLVKSAAELCEEAAISDSLAAAFRSLGVGVFEDLLQGEVDLSTPGGQAVVSVIDGFPPPQAKALVALGLTRHGAAVWRALEPRVSEWSAADWRARLSALVSYPTAYLPAVDALLRSAAPKLAAVGIKVANSRDESVVEQVAAPAAGLLERRLAELDQSPSSRDSDWAACLRWPTKVGQETKNLYGVLLELDSEQHVRLIKAAVGTDALTPQVAAHLARSDAIDELFRALSPGGLRRRLAEALLPVDHETVAAIESICGEAPSLDLVAALAPVDSAKAFAHLQATYLTLSDEDKDECVRLLAAFATTSELPLLEQAVALTSNTPSNRKRRETAARKIGGLLPVHASVPSVVVELLQSSSASLRGAGLEVITTVKPRDPALLELLHTLAKQGGVSGAQASSALDAIADDAIAEFNAGAPTESVIALLGQIGRPAVIEPLLRFVGSEPEDDSISIRRAAANAIHEATRHVNHVEPDVLAALLDRLVEGPFAEIDPQAQDDLAAASAALQLGEDAALRELYTLMPRKAPNTAPGRLFGVEKDIIVRHAGLLSRERQRGQPGWGASIAQLDILAERLTRVGYLGCGPKEAIKEQIRNDPKQPDYGNLIKALPGTKLESVHSEATMLHKLRGGNTEIPHPGKAPKQADMENALAWFGEIAKVCVGIAEQAAKPA